MTLHKWKQKQFLQKWRWLIKKCEKSKKPKKITTYGSKNQEDFTQRLKQQKHTNLGAKCKMTKK
jgi:hypothetical protein